MKKINRQYELRREIAEISSGVKYFEAFDDKNQRETDLIFIEKKQVSLQLLKNIDTMYEKLKNIEIPSVSKVLAFDFVSSVNHQPYPNEAYIIVFERISFQSIHDPSFSFSHAQVLDFLIGTIQILNYLLLKGVVWNFFDFKNIFVNQGGQKGEIFLRNPIGAAMLSDFERFSKTSEFDNYNDNIILDFSFRDFGKIFLSLLFDMEKEDDFGMALSLFKKKEFPEEDDDSTKIIIHIFDQLLSEGYIQRAFLFSSIIDDVNAKFATQYRQILIDRNQNLSLSKNAMIVDKISKSICEEHKKLAERTQSKQFLFVSAKRDESTDRILLDTYRKLSLFDMKIRKFFETGPDDDVSEWIRIFREFKYDSKLMRELGGKQVFLEKYEALLKSGRQMTEADFENRDTMRLLTIAADAFLNNVYEDLGVVVFYHFHSLNPFIAYTVFFAFYFSKKYRNLFIAFGDLIKEENEIIRKIKSALIEDGLLKYLSVDYLDMEETSKFLAERFYNLNLSKEFTDFVFDRSDGNIDGIYRFLQFCIDRDVISFDCRKRTIRITEKYKEYQCGRPEEVIKKYSLSDFEYLSADEQEVLKWMSIFISAQSKKFISKLIRLEFERVCEAVDLLSNRAILVSSVKKGDIVYEIKDDLFKKYIYEDILDKKTKQKLHMMAVSFISGNSEENMIILAKHYQSLNQPQSLRRASNIWLYLANRYHMLMEYDKSEDYYEHALEGVLSPKNRFLIYLSLFKQYNIQTKVEEMVQVSEKLEALADEVDDRELLREFYGRALLGLSYNQIKEMETRYADRLKRMMSEEGGETAGAYYYAYLARNFLLGQEYEESIRHFKKALTLCKEGYRNYDLKAFIYRICALSFFYFGDSDRSLTFNEEALKYSKLGNDVRGELSVNNNTVMVYNAKNQSVKYDSKQLNLLEKNYDLAKKYGIYGIEVISLSNLSNYYSKLGDMKRAFDYGKKAIMRAEETGINESKTGILLNIMYYTMRTGDFIKSHSYYQELVRIQGEGNQLLAIYNKQPMFLFFQLRDFERMYEICMKDHRLDAVQNDLSLIPDKLFVLFCNLHLFGCKASDTSGELDEVFSNYYKWNESVRQEYAFFLYEICFLFYNGGQSDSFEEFAYRLLKIEPVNSLMEAMNAMLQFLLQHELHEDQLQKIEDYLHKEKANNASIQLSMMLGIYYIGKGRKWEGLSYVFKSIRMILTFLKKTPTEYHKRIFENNYFIKPFVLLEYFLEKGEFEGCHFNPDKRVSFEQLDYYLYRMNLYEISGNLQIYQNLISERMAADPKYLSLEEAMARLGDDFEENLSMVIDYMADILFATEGYLCIRVENVFEPVLFVKNGKKQYFANLNTKFDFNKENLVWNMEMDTNPIRAVLSIPIYPKDHYYDTVNQDASASIVFASKKIVNHFDDESFVDLQRCLPILTLFVEDYLLKKMASEDRLTKVLSRRELESEMIYHLSRARDQKSDLAIMILDIDNFKKINDTFGHLTGDAVLQELSAVMKHSLEPNMKIGRYGGEEFIVIMPDKTSQEAFEFAELLRNVLNEHDYASVGDFPITISIGVSTFQKEQDSLSSMIERADEALYKAKKSGKNQSVLWSRELEIKKSESDLAKQMIHENHYKNSRYRLSFVEMISELSGFCSKEEGLYRVLTKMLEALEAREVVVYLTNRKDRNVLSLKRKQTQVEYSAQADLDLVKEIKRHANGFYRNDWSSGSYLNEVTGLIEWSSVLGFEMIDREEAVACVYFKSNLREREFNKQDLRFATVFSTFLLGYLQDNESE